MRFANKAGSRTTLWSMLPWMELRFSLTPQHLTVKEASSRGKSRWFQSSHTDTAVPIATLINVVLWVIGHTSTDAVCSHKTERSSIYHKFMISKKSRFYPCWSILMPSGRLESPTNLFKKSPISKRYYPGLRSTLMLLTVKMTTWQSPHNMSRSLKKWEHCMSVLMQHMSLRYFCGRCWESRMQGGSFYRSQVGLIVVQWRWLCTICAA